MCVCAMLRGAGRAAVLALPTAGVCAEWASASRSSSAQQSATLGGVRVSRSRGPHLGRESGCVWLGGMQPSSPGASRKRPRDGSDPETAKAPRLAGAGAAGGAAASAHGAGQGAPALAATQRGPGRPSAAKERRQPLSLTKVEDPTLVASLQRRILKLVFGSTPFKASKCKRTRSWGRDGDRRSAARPALR